MLRSCRIFWISWQQPRTMASDSESEEDLAKLREALDPSTTKDLYNGKEKDDGPKDDTVAEKSKAVGKGGARPAQTGPSLRRDRREVEEAVGELDVTPAFQRFVASKLDDAIQLEEVEVEGREGRRAEGVEGEGGIKLTRRSRVKVVEVQEVEELGERRSRPRLLEHRQPEVRCTWSKEWWWCAGVGV